MRVLVGLAREGCPLFDAEPVLLIDDDQAQLSELHLVGKQRMGADHNPGFPAGRPQQRRALCRGRQRTGQQHHIGRVLRGPQHATCAQVAQQLGDRLEMLGSQHLSGG